MTGEKFDEKAIFSVARTIESQEARAEYLQQACSSDAKLIERIQTLLRGFEEQASFLDTPPVAIDVTRLAQFDEPIAERPGTVIGPYKLLEQIGEGGMGVVFMAEQVHPVQRTVALKIIKPGMDTRQVIARFEAERQALAMMDHPNIAKVLDAGTTGGKGDRNLLPERPEGDFFQKAPVPFFADRPYFVMELVKGVPITKYCDDKKLSLRERLELFKPVCEAVQHAHQKGIIHRDLKPSNVLVAEYDGTPVPKVIDFGVAKATAQKLTERTMFTEYGQLIGTFEYMSPEQARFNQVDVDTRSDIYSLGIMLYELLAGSTPLEKERLRSAAFDEILRIISEEEPPKPSTKLCASELLPSIADVRHSDPKQLTRELSGELDWIVMKALEKDPSRRYNTASDLAADVRRYLNDEPVSACPPARAYLVKKFVRRNKIAVTATSLIVAALVAGVGLATWGLIKARQGQSFAEVANVELATQLRRVEAAEALTSSQARQLARQLYEIKFPQASVAFNEGNYSIAREILNECPLEQRGWEWRWIARQVSLDMPAKIPGRQLAQFTPDGKYVVAVNGSDEKSVKFWNALTGAVERTVAPSAAPIKQVLLDPHGKQLATGTEDGTIALWDLDSGQQLWKVKVHDRRSDGFAFSPDGARLASAGWDGTVKVLSAKNGEQLAAGHTEQELRGACFSPDGTRIVTAGRNNTAPELTAAQVWDARTGERLFELTDGPARCATYSPQGRWIATGGVDGAARIYDAESGKFQRSLPGHEGFISAIAFSADGARLATSGADATVRIWDVETGKLVIAFKGHASTVNFLSFSPDGRYLATSDTRGVVNLWDVSASDCFTFVQLGSLPRRQSWIWSVAFSSDGARLLAGGADEVILINVDSLVEEKILPVAICRQAAISPDGKEIAAAADRTIVVWNSATGEMRNIEGHENVIEFVAFSPDGTRISSTASRNDETVRLWDAKTGNPLQVFRGHKTSGGAIWAAVFRPDGRELASVTNDGLKIWDVETGALRHNLSVGAGLTCVAYSPDGSLVVAGGKDKLLHKWNAQTGEPLPGFSTAHNAAVWGVAFTPDGSRVISADGVGTVRIWSAETGLPLLTLREMDGKEAHAVAVSPDGNAIAVGRDSRIAFGAFDARDPNDCGVFLWEIDAPRDGGLLRKQSQMASQTSYARLEEQHDSPQAIAAVESDTTLPADVKTLAVRLTEARQAASHERLLRLRQAVNAPDVKADTVWGYAWRLIVDGPADFGDGNDELQTMQEAVRLATKATELAPKNGNCWSTLGAARYRVAEYEGAVEALNRSLELQGDNAFDTFFLAMTEWKLGHPEAARPWFDKAVAWMEKNRPENRELQKFRAEAVEMLSVKRSEPSAQDE